MVSQRDNSGWVGRTSDVSQSYQLQGTETVASPEVPVVSQPDSGCLDCTSAVSRLFRHLTGGTEECIKRKKYRKVVPSHFSPIRVRSIPLPWGYLGTRPDDTAHNSSSGCTFMAGG